MEVRRQPPLLREDESPLHDARLRPDGEQEGGCAVIPEEEPGGAPVFHSIRVRTCDGRERPGGSTGPRRGRDDGGERGSRRARVEKDAIRSPPPQGQRSARERVGRRKNERPSPSLLTDGRCRRRRRGRWRSSFFSDAWTPGPRATRHSMRRRQREHSPSNEDTGGAATLGGRGWGGAIF